MDADKDSMDTNTPKPMDPERLALLRELNVQAENELLTELLADRDRQELLLKQAESERDNAYERGMLDARRAYAKVWADATRTEIGALDFTADRLHAELRSRWLERRSLADGTVPAVGQRVVTVREVAESWGLLHGHDGHVHEITSLLGGHSHLVECGPQQIGVGMLRLAPAGSDVTCPACRGWTVESDRRRHDAQVFRETQFKVAELGRSLADAERERDEAREKTVRDFFVWLVGREAWNRHRIHARAAATRPKDRPSTTGGIVATHAGIRANEPQATARRSDQRPRAVRPRG
jgi:hypothetical protein